VVWGGEKGFTLKEAGKKGKVSQGKKKGVRSRAAAKDRKKKETPSDKEVHDAILKRGLEGKSNYGVAAFPVNRGEKRKILS